MEGEKLKIAPRVKIK